METAKLIWWCVVPPSFGQIECQFNPSSLAIEKSNVWKNKTLPNFNAPHSHFAGGKPATYSLSLFFDTFSSGPEVKDVREYTNQLLRLTLRGAGRSMFKVPYSNPPSVMLVWGKITLFPAVVEKVTITFTMFSPEGIPIRAKADVDLKQNELLGDDLIPFQNPSSRTDARQTRLVHAGQRLDQIAHEAYGDARLWRFLAEANHLDDPFHLSDGQILVIPDFE
jgi:nucleoid-associated protein YgaU